MRTTPHEEFWMVIGFTRHGSGVVVVDMLSQETAAMLVEMWGKKFNAPYTSVSWRTELERKMRLIDLNIEVDWFLRR